MYGMQKGVRRVEKLFKMTLTKHDTPMTQGDHPELDQADFLNDEEHKQSNAN